MITKNKVVMEKKLPQNGYNSNIWNKKLDKLKKHDDLYKIIVDLLHKFIIEGTDYEFNDKIIVIKNLEITPSNYGFSFKEWSNGSASFYSHGLFQTALSIQKAISSSLTKNNQ